MSAQVTTIRWESWALSEEADRRFRRIVLIVAVPAIILAILLSIFQMEVKKAESSSFNGARYAELVAEQPGEVAPPEQPKPAAKDSPQPPKDAAPPKPVQKPTPQPVPQPSAREQAQKTQEMKVIQDQLKDLRDQNLNTLSDQPLVSSTITSKGGIGGSAASAEAIAQSAAANSGNGIGGTGAVTSSQSGTGLGSRRTGSVQSPVGFGRSANQIGANGQVNNARSLTEIQEVFDRNKGSLTSIYNRQARENPNMGDGKLVLKLTIAPDGTVTQCTVVSSSFNDPDFDHKIVQRILLFKFAAKNVPPFTYNSYPIEFHPM